MFDSCFALLRVVETGSSRHVRVVKGFPPPSSGYRNAREPSSPHRPSRRGGGGTPFIYLASCRPCRVRVWVWGMGSSTVCGLPGFGTSGEHWISGVVGLIRPHSVAPFPILATRPGHLLVDDHTSDVLVGRPLLETCRTTRMPVHHIGGHTPSDGKRCATVRCRRTARPDRDRGVSPAVSSRQVCTPAGCLPHALGDGWAVSADRAGARQEGEISVARWLVRLLFKQCRRYRHGHRVGMGTVLA